MNFDLNNSISLLKRAPAIYKTYLQDLSEDWVYANEGENTWSAFDIVGHLIHGEKTDWIPRSRIILSDQVDKTFIPFDRFAQEQSSKGKSIQELLNEFDSLRKENVKELESWNLSDADLSKTGTHPELGIVTLRQMISMWTIHDLAHLHQISRVMVKHYKDDIGPWIAYSGILNQK